MDETLVFEDLHVSSRSMLGGEGFEGWDAGDDSIGDVLGNDNPRALNRD